MLRHASIEVWYAIAKLAGGRCPPYRGVIAAQTLHGHAKHRLARARGRPGSSRAMLLHNKAGRSAQRFFLRWRRQVGRQKLG